MLGVCAAVDAIAVGGDPHRAARLEQGHKIVAGSHNIRAGGGGGTGPQVGTVLVTFCLHGLREVRRHHITFAEAL